MLSPEAIARLDSICAQLDHSAANAQIAVVTVHDLNGDDAADYANQLEDHWKMGNKGDNKYAMVLLAVADHKYRIEVGYGLEGILPDGKIGDIGRDMVPDLKASDYDGAVTLAVGEVAQVIADDAKITLNQDQPTDAPQPVQQSSGGMGKLILILIMLLLFGGGSLLRILFGAGLFFGGWGRGGWGGGSGTAGRIWRRWIRRWGWWRLWGIRRWRRRFWRRRRWRKLVKANCRFQLWLCSHNEASEENQTV